MLTPDELDMLVEDYSYLMMKVAAKHVPYFTFLAELLPKHLDDCYSPRLNKKTTVIPLTCLRRNEQKYGDTVEILRFYEELIKKVHVAAGEDLGEKKVHVGGDQLTRERFSGAKLLMIGSETPAGRFDHLGPISFEFFHLAMKFLSLCFKCLFHAEDTATGTMRSESVRIQRHNIDPEVKNAYNADKDFFISFTDAYIVEAVCDYFKLDDVFSTPTEIPADEGPLTWAKAHFRKMAKSHVGTFMKGNATHSCGMDMDMEEMTSNNEAEENNTVQVTLPSGKTITIILKPKPAAKPVKSKPESCVRAYGSLVLELGLLFKNFLESVETPNRPRMLRTLKLMMVLLKAQNNLSKYADEILRFLVLQLCSLSERKAHEMFYGLYVNTRGKVNSHIAVDLQMEFIVRSIKRHIKHMFSNKTEQNIERKSGALASINEIVSRFDTTSDVIKRCKRHTTTAAHSDELEMAEDLRSVKPFDTHTHRQFTHVPNVQSSLLHRLDFHHFRSWLHRRSEIHRTHLGN